MRAHTKVLDKTKLGILGAALLSYGVHAYDTQPPEGFLPAPAAISTSLFHISEGQDKDFLHTFASGGMRLQRNPDLRPLPSRLNTVSDPSSVFLLSYLDNGDVATGTGTIVKGNLDTHRVLTAGHVITSDTVNVIRTMAFDGNGQYLAQLTPVVTMFQDLDKMKFGASNLMNDAGVMEVKNFSSADADAVTTWNDRAAEISPQQSAHPLFVTNGTGDITLNGGASGASLKNTAGQIIGIIVQSTRTAENVAPQTAHSFAFLDKINAADEDGLFTGITPLLKLNKMTVETQIETFGLAAPVIQEDILDALGVANVEITQDIPAFHATVAAFPAFEAATSSAYVTPMTHYDAESFINPAMTKHYGVENTSSIAMQR